MNAYVCVYRQIIPSPKELKKTELSATQNSVLRRFIDEYNGSFYDWGDDPSFFSAKHWLSDVNGATWGVCRRDVRSVLNKGDVVVFFCGSQIRDKGSWHYYLIGFGTVREIVKRRELLWKSPVYARFRKFYNLLVDSKGNQGETFRPFHENWEDRAKAPYVIFDSKQSVFNLDSPHPVATWDGEGKQEAWKTDRRTREIERLLFDERGIRRRLRTSATGFAHPKLNLLREGKKDRPGRDLSDLTQSLRKLI